MNSEYLDPTSNYKIGHQENIQNLFQKLYKKTASKIISSLRKKGANKSDAEDSYHEALKEMLLKYYNKSLSFDIEDAEKYLWVVAKNNLIAKLRLKGQFVEFGKTEDQLPYEIVEENDNLKSEIAKKIISLFSEKCKEILTERLINSKKHLEIAKKLSTNEETAKKKYQRCLEKLRETSDFEKLKKIYYEY
jgi:RNA polymerase sigma factor (sigma-70 family)